MTAGTDQTAAESYCETNTQEYHGSPWCSVQAPMITYWSLAGVAWWCIQAVDVALDVVFELRVPRGSDAEKVRNVVYHVWSWGASLIPVAIGFAYNSWGASGIGQAWCFYTTGRCGAVRCVGGAKRAKACKAGQGRAQA